MKLLIILILLSQTGCAVVQAASAIAGGMGQGLQHAHHSKTYECKINTDYAGGYNGDCN